MNRQRPSHPPDQHSRDTSAPDPHADGSGHAIPPDDDALDAIFGALSDRTRRRILMDLMDGARPVSALAAPHGMSQPAISKHLKVLEQAGLIDRRKHGTARPAELSPRRLDIAGDWVTHFRAQMQAGFQRLEGLLVALQSDAHPRSDAHPTKASDDQSAPIASRADEKGPASARQNAPQMTNPK